MDAFQIEGLLFVHVLYARQLKGYRIHASERNPITSDVISSGYKGSWRSQVSEGEKHQLLSEPLKIDIQLLHG